MENGDAAASRKFSKELGKTLAESTIRGMSNAYEKNLTFGKLVTSLPTGDHSRPLLLGKEWDNKVKDFVNAVRKSGGSMSTKLLLAGTKGLLQAAKPPILVEHGGPITIDKSWGRSLLDRMGYTKRKVTKGIKHHPGFRPDDIDKIRGRFYRCIGRRVRKYEIKDKMIINWEQTSVEVIPTSLWSMNKKGEKQIPLKGSDISVGVYLGW